MRAYIIEDLSEENIGKVRNALTERGWGSGYDDVFYLPVPDEFLEDDQKEHLSECGPYVSCLELDEDRIKLELLIRARGRMRCNCVRYANPALRGHLLDLLDGFLRELDVPV